MGSESADLLEEIFEELSAVPPSQALQVVSRWLASNRLDAAANTLQKEISTDPSRWGADAPATQGSGNGLSASNGGGAAATASTASPPVGEALPVPGTSTRPGRLFDAEPIDPSSVPDILLTKPDPVFFGERDEKKLFAKAVAELCAAMCFLNPS